MAQIPQLPDRSRLHGIPNAASAPRVTPDDFGSRLANDVGRLGGAVANAGQAQMVWARQNAESQARAEYSAVYMRGMEEDRTRILQTTGSESFESRKMMEEAIRKRSEASQKNLQNPFARAVFDGMRQDFDRQNMVVSDRHATTQRKAYDTTTREAMKSSLIAESAMDGGNNFAGNIQKIKAENEAIHAGQPREYIDLQNQKDAMLAVKARAAHLGRENPAAALDFLNSGVEAEIGDGAALKLEFDALRGNYQKADKVTRINRTASEWANDPNITPDMAIDMADELFPDDAQSSGTLIRKYNANLNARDNARKAETTEWKAEVRSALAQNGFDMDAVPNDVLVRDPDYYLELSKLCDDIAQIGGKDIVPDLASLDGLLAKSPSEIRVFLYEADNFRKMTVWGAGHIMGDDRIKEIQEKSKMTDAEWTEKQSKSGGGDNQSMTRYSIPLGDYFKQNYPRMFTSWRGSEKTFDPKSEDDKLLMTNFEVYYDMAYRREQEALGRRLTEAESEGLFYDQMEKVKRGDIDINKPTAELYLSENNAETARVAVDPATLVLDQKTIYAAGRDMGWSGEVYQTKNAETDQMETFETLDPQDAWSTPFWAKNHDAAAARRAYQGGVASGIAYQPGDVILTLATGAEAVLGSDGKPRGVGISPEQQQRQDFERMTEAERPDYTEKPPEWRDDLLESLKREYGDDLTDNWTGNQLVVETPSLVLTYNDRGNLIATQVNRASFQ